MFQQRFTSPCFRPRVGFQHHVWQWAKLELKTSDSIGGFAFHSSYKSHLCHIHQIQRTQPESWHRSRSLLKPNGILGDISKKLSEHKLPRLLGIGIRKHGVPEDDQTRCRTSSCVCKDIINNKTFPGYQKRHLGACCTHNPRRTSCLDGLHPILAECALMPDLSMWMRDVLNNSLTCFTSVHSAPWQHS